MKKMEGTPGLDTNATWEEEIPEHNKITADAVERMMERQDRERREGRLGADETLFPEGAPLSQELAENDLQTDPEDHLHP